MILFEASGVDILANHVAKALGDAPDDPFVEDIVVAGSPGIQRWLAQQVGLVTGTGPANGICACVSFLTMDRLMTRLRGGPSPWSSSRLLNPVLNTLDRLPDVAEYSQLLFYLGRHDRPSRRLDLAKRVCALFSRYARHNIEMLDSWAHHDDIGPDGDPLDIQHLWQPRLFTAVASLIGTPSDDLAAIEASASTWISSIRHLVIFCPSDLPSIHATILEEIDQIHEIRAYGLTTRTGPSRLTSAAQDVRSTLNDHAREIHVLPDHRPAEHTMLGAVHDVLAGQDPQSAHCDDSLSIYASHGIDRQVEVLRDVLLDLMASDHDLQPRDILVMTPNVADVEGAIVAAFAPDDTEGADPGHMLHVRTAGGTIPNNPLIDVLVRVLDLTENRATVDDLITLCLTQPVMTKLGLTESDRAIVERIIRESGIRWGISASGRQRFSMGEFAQNTWLAGMNRIVLGTALSETGLVMSGTTLPLDSAGTSPRLAEAITHLIWNVGTTVQSWQESTTGHQWVDRLRTCARSLADPFDPQFTAAMSCLAPLEDYDVQLSAREVARLCRDLVARRVGRMSILSGWLTVTDMSTMSLVPHKAIVLLRLDSLSFPRQPSSDGDDLTRKSALRADETTQDRLHFLNAVMSASQRLVVIYSGFDPTTNAQIPMPTPVSDLLDIVSELAGIDSTDSIVHRESAQPFSLSEIPHPTFDLRIAEASSALMESARHTDDELMDVDSEVPHANPHPAAQTDIDAIAEFFASPADQWIRTNTGIRPSFFGDPEPPSAQIPIAANALDLWKIQDRMVRLLRNGDDPSQIMRAEMARGTVAPHQAGATVVEKAMTRSQAIVSRAASHLEQPAQWYDILVPAIDGAPPCHGRVMAHGTSIVDVFPGKIRAKHQINAWVRLLGLQASHPDVPWTCILIGDSTQVRLAQPNPSQATEAFDHLRRLYTIGLGSPLPLPPRAAASCAWHMNRHCDPFDDPNRRRQIMTAMDADWRDPSWGLVWGTPQRLLSELPLQEEEAWFGHFPTRFTCLAHAVYLPLLEAGGTQ